MIGWADFSAFQSDFFFWKTVFVCWESVWQTWLQDKLWTAVCTRV